VKRIWLGTAVAVVAVGIASSAWASRQHRINLIRDGAPGAIAIHWSGAWVGHMLLPAQVQWCPVNRTGVLEGISGDSGFTVVLYENNALTVGNHPVVAASMAASAPRPGAIAALRWPRFERDSSVSAFESQRGTVHIDAVGGKMSGKLTIRLRATGGADSLQLTGVFRDVPVTSTAIGCG
jgi:hypothetical protein